MHVFEFGPYVVDFAERRLTRNSEQIPVAGKALEILQALIEAEGRLVTLQALYARLWPDVVVEERNLTVHISTLRKLLNNDDTLDYIETVPKAGYRFAGAVKARAPAGKAIAVAHATPSAVDHAPPARHRRRLTWAAAAALMVAVMGGSVWIAGGTSAWQSESRREVSITIAVLPFATAGLDAAESYLGLGVADAIITRLSGLSGVGMRPLGAARELSGTADPAVAGRKIQVNAVLDGLIQREHDRLRVSTHLIDTESGLTRWSESFELPLAGVFRLQDAVAMRVTTALLPQLPPAERARLQQETTRSPEAYLLQLEARVNMNRGGRDALYKAMEQFLRAINLDPDYAYAHAGLAHTYLLLTSTTPGRPMPVTEALPLARAAAQRALALDERIGEAHAVLGRIAHTYEWNWRGAEDSLRDAVELSPNSAEALEGYGWLLVATGRREKALEILQHSLRLDPLRIPTLEHLALAQWYSGEPTRALATLGEAIAIAPSARRPRFRRMAILEHLRSFDDAMNERLTWLAMLGRTETRDRIAELYTGKGHREAAVAWIAFLLSVEQWWEAAETWMALGNHERALGLLERCVAAQCDAAPLLGEHPVFRPLHDAPRFRALLRKIGLDRRSETLADAAD